MLNSFGARVGVSLFLTILISITSIPGSAAETAAPAANLGDIVTSGDVLVDGKQVNFGKVVDGDRISTGKLSSATVTLHDGNEFRISDETAVDLRRPDQKVQLRLSLGEVSFVASNNRFAISVGEYEIVPEENANGHVALVDGKHVSIQLKSGRITLHSPSQPAAFMSGKSERVFTLVAANLPSTGEQAPAQPPATNQAQPEIFSMTPAEGTPGNSVTVTILGRFTQFGSATTVKISGTGATVGAVNVADATHLTFEVALAGTAKPGHEMVTVTTGSDSITSHFIVNEVPPNTAAKGKSQLPLILGLSGGFVAAAEYIALKDDWNKCPPNCPTIRTTSLPDGTVGSEYTSSVSASGGTPPYTWVSSGLPDGLRLDSASGEITGIPSSEGSSSFKLYLIDSKKAAADGSFSINITATLSISTDTLPGGAVQKAYSQPIVATGGTEPYTWTLSSGALPAGLSLNSNTGLISGTPTTAESANFNVTVTDSASQQATAEMTLSIEITLALTINTSTLPGGTIQTAYSQPVVASGGTEPYAWTLSSGTLPAGLSLNIDTGEISGTPTGAEALSFSVTVTDSSSPPLTASKTLKITITPALTISTTTLPGGTLQTAYSQPIVVAGGTAPYTWALTLGTLPAGLSLDTRTGVISGTPTAPATTPFFFVSVNDSSSPQLATSRTFSISLPPALTISTTTLPAAPRLTAYSQPVAATGGTVPYTWTLSAGTLPVGLNLNSSTGVISGTPIGVVTTSLFTVTVKDSASPQATANKALSIAVCATPASCPITLELFSSLDVTKSADRPVVAPGDPISFNLEIANSSTTHLATTSLSDTLPPGFAFTSGSALLHILGTDGMETGVQAITPIVSSTGLDFPIGALAAGSRIAISYTTVVKSDAHPGEAKGSVVGLANLLSGRRVTSNPAHVKVTVTAGAFSLNQVLIGRVFDDRNRNGKFDDGEPGVANVRVVTSSGQSATTGRDGQYSLPSLAGGSVLVAMDPATIPPGFGLTAGESRLGGSGRLMVTPLDGGGLLRQNFGLIRTGSALTPATPSSSASATARNEREYDSPKSARLEISVDRPILAAGAYDRQLIRIHARNSLDLPIDSPIVVTTTLGAVMAANQDSDQFACESVLSLDQRPDLSRHVELDTRNGEAAVCLISALLPGTTQLTAITTGSTELRASSEIRFETAHRAPLLVGIGELGIGLSGPGRNATDDARRVDGSTSIFYQSSLRKSDLLTVAVRSKGSVNSATGMNGLFEFDPTQRIYPVMGDSSTRQELGQSSGHIYTRYDRGRSYVMYGDLHGDTAADGRSSLLEYNRNVTGLRFQIQGQNQTNLLQGQISKPRTAYEREITTALAGSAIRLSHTQIIRGSENITLEVRDRRRPETIISRETLVRNIDYSLDPLSGILFMMRSVSLFDASLNIVQVVSTYEYESTTIHSAAYLGRGSYSFSNMGMRLGFSALSQAEQGLNFAMGGLELEQKLLNGGYLKAELPISSGRVSVIPGTSTDSSKAQNGKAIRAEFNQPVGPRRTVLHGNFTRTDPGFLNPYGAVTVQGQQSRGISVNTAGFNSGTVSFGISQERNRNSAADNQRQTIGAMLTQPLGEELTAQVGIDHRLFEDHASGAAVDSNLLYAGLKWKPLARLETSIRREQNTGDADPTYPSQTLLGVQYKLSSANRIFATQRFSSAPIQSMSGAESSGILAPQSTKETAIGIESRLRQNTSLTTNYSLDSSATGSDSFAVLGVLTRIPVRSGLSIDWSINNAVHLAGSSKGYVGGSIGITEMREDKLLISSRYELRRREKSESIFTAGIAGRLTASTSAMAHFRAWQSSELPVGLRDGQVALSLRPKKSDRVALLFSYDFSNATVMTPIQNGFKSGKAPATPVPSVTVGQTSRMSTDGLVQLADGFELYSRVAVAQTPGFYGGSRLGKYVQGRLQKSLTRRFDIAGEARWIQESRLVRGSLITGVEWGSWITRDLRVGLGYSPSGFANPGALLNSTAARGGAYLVVSSRLSSMFDLMGGIGKSK